jgi:cell division protein FtsB
MTPKSVANLVIELLAEPLGAHKKELNALRKDVATLKNQIKLLQVHERGRAARELVRATEADE